MIGAIWLLKALYIVILLMKINKMFVSALLLFIIELHILYSFVFHLLMNNTRKHSRYLIPAYSFFKSIYVQVSLFYSVHDYEQSKENNLDIRRRHSHFWLNLYSGTVILFCIRSWIIQGKQSWYLTAALLSFWNKFNFYFYWRFFSNINLY